MEPSLLMWGIFTFIAAPGHMTEFCDDNPPDLKHATFKALTYKTGTMLNCECRRGFRRISNGSALMLCAGNASHSSWENKCQCISTSPRTTDGHITPKPEEQKGKKSMELQSQMQPMDQVNLPGHCSEPPPWEYEHPRRIYHFVVGQTVRYQCAQGFRALQWGPAVSICKMICGKTKWTWPQLKCISERKDSRSPDDEESQAPTEAPPGSDTFCPSIPTSTTDFQKHTEVARTAESFVFTTEYQIAVAGCVLLLVSVVLLSLLTWQRRRRKSRRTI
ncbi:interleukin-2 receptor subunit alpha [Suricata suricatta]|uniref:Interleukin-2 receptor subunit alpha n=1 Tax=Suricata suricatta TaxID=37032 RepID=A0A673U1J7_SURSU|nr:interleukin-2 receptor subunit alpha [Suricata suricatta]